MFMVCIYHVIGYFSIILLMTYMFVYLNVCFVQEHIEISIIQVSECILLHVIFNYTLPPLLCS
jgi:hypothetical protein